MTRSQGYICIEVSHCSAIERLWGPVVVDNIVALAVLQFSAEDIFRDLRRLSLSRMLLPELCNLVAGDLERSEEVDPEDDLIAGGRGEGAAVGGVVAHRECHRGDELRDAELAGHGDRGVLGHDFAQVICQGLQRCVVIGLVWNLTIKC